ncbi:DUF1553 domain-containing protein [bacterium]|nr:DUF1553 domain-containing protein [bacterium]
MIRSPYLLSLLYVICVCVSSEAAAPSFRNDVMAVVSKAGCNLGTCHGNARGKGGFQLSLRGQDPNGDYDVLTRDWLSRRTNVSEPDRSLLLLKPTMQLAHEGGQRFTRDSQEYAILRDWIAAGMPKDTESTPQLTSLDVAPQRVILEAPNWNVELKVYGNLSDGKRRPLNGLAVYKIGQPIAKVSHDGLVHGESAGETVVLVRYLDQQVPVRLAFIPQRDNFTWNGPTPANVVDQQVFAKLQELKLQPAALADDVTFIRRSTLDIIGRIPSAEEAQQFLNDKSADKRARWIDQLLERPEFADWWALKWADMLRLEEKTLDAKGAGDFHAWLRDAMSTGQPLDQLVHDLITSRGSTYSEPASNFYRALRDPFTRSEAVGQLFLGVRLQCSKCHNHPFDRWTQDDYYAWGNVFARVDYKILENERRDTNDKHEFSGEQIVFMKDNGDVDDPRTGQPRTPKLLGEAAPELVKNRDRLVQLADWLTSANNDRFAEMLVNRIWRHLMGRGLVEPVDDFRATNPASHPELLLTLSQELRSSGFDLRHMVRLIANSKTYQLSGQPATGQPEDDINYSHAHVQRLSAEQLADALADVTGVAVPYRDFPKGTRAVELPGVGAMLRRRGGPAAGDEWLRVFGRPPRLQSCECERTEETTLTQAFQLLSSELIQQLTADPQNTAAKLAKKEPADQAITDLYWTTVSRRPGDQELAKLTEYVRSHEDTTVALQDVLWSLVTSHEFLLRR